MLEMVNLRSLTKKDKKGKLVNLKDGEVAATKQRDEMKTAATNIVTYLNMKGAGHKMYGLGYLFCQVEIYLVYIYFLHLGQIWFVVYIRNFFNFYKRIIVCFRFCLLQ